MVCPRDGRPGCALVDRGMGMGGVGLREDGAGRSEFLGLLW